MADEDPSPRSRRRGMTSPIHPVASTGERDENTLRSSWGWDQTGHADLVRELRAGNAEAHNWAHSNLRPVLLAYARRFLPGTEEVEDVVQDAFLRLWTHRDSLRVDGSVKSLLLGTVRARCIDHYRRRARRRALAVNVPSPTPLPCPAKTVEALELSDAIEEAVGGLRERKKRVFLLVREKGLSHREVARTMAISPQTVANTMSSALSDLRSALGLEAA
jgi:RNA polymerase sigma-70 factor (ECF subfamily)